MRSSPRPAARLALAVLLVAVGVGVFANSLDGPFLFDDTDAVLNNANIRSLQPLSTAMWAPPDNPVTRRPLVSLSLALNYAADALAPRGYHIVNLTIHLANTLLVFVITAHVLSGRRVKQKFNAIATEAAFACALLWMIHPVQTEVVDYVTQRTESMMAFFFLAGFYASLRSLNGRSTNWQWAVVAVLAGVCGAACKEPIAVLPLVVFAYDAAFEGGSVRAAAARWQFYAAFAIVWAFLGALIWFSPPVHSSGVAANVNWWNYLLNQAGVLVRYLRLAVWPTALVADYGEPRTITLAEAALPGAVVLLMLAVTLYAWRAAPPLGFLGVWLFANLAMTSSIIPIATEVGAERRMYLSLAAVVVLAVVAAAHVLEWFPVAAYRRWIGVGLLTATAASFALLTMRRNVEYREPAALWKTVLDRYPHARAHYALGIELNKRRDSAKALHEFQLAAAEYPRAHYAIAELSVRANQPGDAVAHLRTFVEKLPTDADVPSAYALIGQLLLKEGRYDDSIRAYDESLSRLASNVSARQGLAAAYNLRGVVHVRNDQVRQAADDFSRSVALVPNDPNTRENLANALATTGELDSAIAEYRRAVALLPSKGSLHSGMAVLLMASGRRQEAAAELRLAITLSPGDERVRNDVMIASRMPALRSAR